MPLSKGAVATNTMVTYDTIVVMDTEATLEIKNATKKILETIRFRDFEGYK